MYLTQTSRIKIKNCLGTRIGFGHTHTQQRHQKVIVKIEELFLCVWASVVGESGCLVDGEKRTFRTCIVNTNGKVLAIYSAITSSVKTIESWQHRKEFSRTKILRWLCELSSPPHTTPHTHTHTHARNHTAHKPPNKTFCDWDNYRL